MRTPSTSVPGLSGLRSLRPLDTRMLEHDVNTQVGHVSGFPNFAIVAKFIHHAKMEGDKAIYSSRNIPIALSSARLLRPQRDLSQVDQLTD